MEVFVRNVRAKSRIVQHVHQPVPVPHVHQDIIHLDLHVPYVHPRNVHHVMLPMEHVQHVNQDII